MSARALTALVLIAIVIAAIVWFVQERDSTVGASARPARNIVASVIVAHPQLKNFAEKVEALGTVRANESVDLTAKVAGRVAAIKFREGQQVHAGDVLIELDSDEARADLAAAQAAASESRSQFKRSQELFQTHVLSEAQLDQLQATVLSNDAKVQAARSRLNDRIISAPFAGRVGLRNVSLGGLVNPGTVITTLDDTSVVKLDFSVPEVFLAQVKTGLQIQARTSAYADRLFTGRVASVDTRVDPVSRAVTVRALIDNKDGSLKPGMFMTVQLVRPEGKALFIPEQAIVPEGEEKYVFTVKDGKASRVAVSTGRRRPGEVEILEGLKPDDVVVIEGTQKVHDGAAVKAASQPS
ncbi:MAG TPA: efflux RND transporter periplasmic adaptor subunit [Steroidobacteraceae bacterium]|nr:efflux RND transporter periplasmic adaptor subunit [Steroidobacteraceae bacterium]